MGAIQDFWDNNSIVKALSAVGTKINGPLQKVMAPLRAEWRIFANRYPKFSRFVKFGIRLFTVLFLALAFVFLLAAFGIFGKLPSHEQLKYVKTATASEAYTEDGVLLGRYFMENRTTVNYSDIATSVINALVATEDSRFFQHSGVDLRSTIRVALKSVLLRDESSGGGSTLSQQLAKNLFKRKKFWILSLPINKIREIIIASRLESLHTKEELLTLYLNTVPFGNNVFGIHMASMRYFSKPPVALRPEESAVLIGMLKATTSYNPVKNPDKAKQRRNVVLDQMEKNRYLATPTCDSLKLLPLKIQFNTERTDKDFAPYFREHIRVEVENLLKDLKKEDGSPYDLYADGLKIYTTLDSKLQQYATESIAEHLETIQKRFDAEWGTTDPWADTEVTNFVELEMKKSKRYKLLKESKLSEGEILKIFETPVDMTVFSWKGPVVKKMSPLDSIKYYNRIINAGFIVMETGTGKIKAWIGGTDFQYFQFDHIKSRRQVGSTFKPILYARALQSRISPCEYLPNTATTYDVTKYSYKYERRIKGEDRRYWTPANADHSSGGSYHMEDALRKSLNLVSANLIMRDSVTPDSVRLLAGKMGIDTNKILAVPALALGAAEIPLYEMVQAYGTFANHGQRLKPMMITRIEDADGKIIVENKPIPTEQQERVLSIVEADLMNHLMKKVVAGGTAQRLVYQYGLNFDIAGKTGTSQNNSDGWFIGYTSNLIAGAWVGAETPAVHFKSLELGQGASTALPIWGKFMQKVVGNPNYSYIKEAKFPVYCDSVKHQLLCIPEISENDTTEILEIPFAPDSLVNDIEELIELPKESQKDKNKNNGGGLDQDKKLQ